MGEKGFQRHAGSRADEPIARVGQPRGQPCVAVIVPDTIYIIAAPLLKWVGRRGTRNTSHCPYPTMTNTPYLIDGNTVTNAPTC